MPAEWLLAASATASALSAAAAWRSSFIARQAAARANLPYVWPVVRIGKDGGQLIVWVRLHNDGPGLAQDVVAGRLEPNGPKQEWVVTERTPVVRGLRGGESLPAEHVQGFSLGPKPQDDVFSIAVRWTDTASRRWELIVPQDPHELTGRPKRLRRSDW